MSAHIIPSVRFARRRSVGTVLGQCWSVLGEMARAHRTRQLLVEMDDRLLSDIGIGRGDALNEASRAMWDLAPPRR